MTVSSTPGQARRLELMPKDAFAALSLHEKNSYLQDLADRFAAGTGRTAFVLDKDALSRLRRFYTRRSFADLRLDQLPDTDIGRALHSLGSAIKEQDIKADVIGALKSELPSPVLREPPKDDAQLAFFVPTIFDAPIKDDVNLMDVAAFSLGKNKRFETIRYELRDSIITISANAEYGLATVFDYDIFLHMVTHLAEEYRRYKIAKEKGLRVDLPATTYRPHAAHILKFSRRSSGGRQYKDLEAALDRLKGTQIKVVNLNGGKRREALGVSLIHDYRVVSTTTTGHVDLVEIEIPRWVYDNVVREKGHPQILTLNPDYFLISQGIGRLVYRLARRAAGKTEARYSMRELHKRSGSTQALPQFAQMLKQFVGSTRMFPFPDYELTLVDGERDTILLMRFRGEGALTDTGKAPELPLG